MITELLQLLEQDVYTDAPEYAERVENIRRLVARERAKHKKREGAKHERVLLTLLRKAVHYTEKAWDAQRDFEMELGRDVDQLSEWVGDLAVVGAEAVTLENVREITEENSNGDE